MKLTLITQLTITYIHLPLTEVKGMMTIEEVPPNQTHGLEPLKI